MTASDVTPHEPYDDRAEAQAEVLAARVEARVAGWLARMPRRYRGEFACKPLVAEWTAALVAAGPDAELPCLWLAGGTGAGKTRHVWRGVGEVAYRAGWAGAIAVMTGPQFFEVAAPQTDYAQLRRLAAVDVLVLDDLDAAEATDWLRQHLYSVIHERWEQARPTVITTNNGDLGRMVGARVASRLHPVTRVPFDEKDHRRGVQA